MDYLDHFNLTAEPFSHAPTSGFYYGSRQHQDAERRLMHVARSMKGLALLIGDIGHGKTTLARRLLDSMPDDEFEAAMLVIVHTGVTANWLLKRIAIQLGVQNPGDDKLTILSQLYQRLMEVHQSGRRAVVLIDEAQMLASRTIMEEFRGLLNLEVPGHKLISFIFFGLPDLEANLQLDPPLAQRVAMRYHLKSLDATETAAYVKHRLQICGAERDLFPPDALEHLHRLTNGVPRVINTLADNVLLEMYFQGAHSASPSLVLEVAENLGLGGTREITPPAISELEHEPLATAGSAGEEAIVAVSRSGDDAAAPGMTPEDIAFNVAAEPAEVEPDVDQGPPSEPVAAPPDDAATTVDIDDPLAFLASEFAPEEDEEPLPASGVVVHPPQHGPFVEIVSASRETVHGLVHATTAADPTVNEAISVQAPFDDELDVELDDVEGEADDEMEIDLDGVELRAEFDVSSMHAESEVRREAQNTKPVAVAPAKAAMPTARPQGLAKTAASSVTHRKAEPAPAKTTSRPKTIDLNEIDALLADINKTTGG